MSQPIELVIFDCDGVLVDSERLAVQIESRLITELGWPLSPDDILHRFVGHSDVSSSRAVTQESKQHAPPG